MTCRPGRSWKEDVKEELRVARRKAKQPAWRETAQPGRRRLTHGTQSRHCEAFS